MNRYSLEQVMAKVKVVVEQAWEMGKAKALVMAPGPALVLARVCRVWALVRGLALGKEMAVVSALACQEWALLSAPALVLVLVLARVLARLELAQLWGNQPAGLRVLQLFHGKCHHMMPCTIPNHRRTMRNLH